MVQAAVRAQTVIYSVQLLKRQHLLLVTLLLTNSAAMEALPIFLDRSCSLALY